MTENSDLKTHSIMERTFFIIVLLFSTFAQAQEKKPKQETKPLDEKNIQKGNELFKKEEFVDAEAQYRIANSKKASSQASYNLGTTIYKQKQPKEAKFAFAEAIEKATTKEEKHKASHNLGNVFMKEKKYAEAVEAYKNALRNNPRDEKTRYNFALAKEMLEKNPPPPNDDKGDDQEKDQNKDQDQQNQKDQNKEQDQDQKNKDDSEGKQDEKEKQDQNKGNQDNQESQEGQPKPQGISKESLERLLEAVNNEEKKVQDKINAEKVKGKPVQTEKDW